MGVALLVGSLVRQTSGEVNRWAGGRRRAAQPDKITVSPHEQADQRALHMAGFVVITARPLHRARVMNITHNRNLITAGHTALFINTPANKNRTLLQCSYPNLSTMANHRCSVGPVERTKTGTAIASIEPLRRLLKLAMHNHIMIG